jgi:hypothetical protein
MEIPRHWRIINLLGYKIKGTSCDDNHPNFPANRPVCIECGKPTKIHPLAKEVISESTLTLPPDDQVIHSEVIWKNQE